MKRRLLPGPSLLSLTGYKITPLYGAPPVSADALQNLQDTIRRLPDRFFPMRFHVCPPLQLTTVPDTDHVSRDIYCYEVSRV